jgi:hypothetical protein
LNDFWTAWFDLRRKTLFDFEVGEAIKYWLGKREEIKNEKVRI